MNLVVAAARGSRNAKFLSAIRWCPVPGGTGRCPAACCDSNNQEPFCGRPVVKNLDVATRNLNMPNFSPLFGRTLCPAALGGARRPVAKAVVKNPLVAGSSSEKSSCGDGEGISKCRIFLRYLVAPVLGGTGRCPAAGGDSTSIFLCFSSPVTPPPPSSVLCKIKSYFSLCVSSPAPRLLPPPYNMLCNSKTYLFLCFYFLAHPLRPPVYSVV